MVRMKSAPGHKRLVTPIRLSEFERAELQSAADDAEMQLGVYIREEALKAARRRRSTK